MKHILTLAALVFATACFGQVPEFVPTNGLVAFYPLDGHGEDQGTNGFDCVLTDVTAATGSQGESSLALEFDGASSFGQIPFDIGLAGEFSLSVWIRSDLGIFNYNPVFYIGDALNCENESSQIEAYVGNGGLTVAMNRTAPESSAHYFTSFFYTEWTQLGLSLNQGILDFYINGTLLESWPMGSLNESNSDAFIGYGQWISGDCHVAHFNGGMDNMGLWNRGLSQQEMEDLYHQFVSGCIDESACNFNPEANVEDGTCDMVSCHCLEGTAWDESLEGCIPLVSAETACGEGTVWDTEAQHCVIANPSDTDFDGCVGMTDLLDLLTVFGTCNEIPWSCGDPLEYQDYDYETVQIGEQCWFAENLRTSTYRSGETIALWDYEGEVVDPGIGHYTYKDLNPDNVDEFGLLYTWHTTSSVCPSGWHVPLVEEFELLLEYASQSGFSSNTPEALQSTSYWPSGLGVDAFGFNALPGGERTPWGNLAPEDFEYGFWWMSDSSEAPNVFHLSMSGDASENFLGIGSCDNPDDAMSIRCLKDSE